MAYATMTDSKVPSHHSSAVRDDDWSLLLVKVGKERCQKSFAHLFAHYAPLIKGFYLQHTNTSIVGEMADELVQEVMLKVWTKAPTFDPCKAAANTWVYTVMRNCRIDLLRRSSRHSIASDPIGVEDIWDETLDHQPFVRLLQSRDKDMISNSFQNLPEEQKHALNQVYMQGKSHSEIAQETGLPLGTVKSRVRMGLKKLQASLTGN